MRIAIHHVTESDRLTFERLHADYLAEVEPDNPHAPEGWLDNVFTQGLTGQRCLWFAKLESEVIGFVDFKLLPFFAGSNDKFAVVHDFYIAPSYRRHGFGKELAQRVVEEAQRQKVKSVELNISPHNPNAMSFWQNVGFKLRHYSLEMDTGAA